VLLYSVRSEFPILSSCNFQEAPLKVRKAVIPVAGFGTRFLPATRAVPKNLLPVLDTPVIHFAVEEAAKAGIEHIVLVMSQRQEAMGYYFGKYTELELALEKKGNKAMLEKMLAIPKMVEISYVYQHEQMGLGHAVKTAKAVVGREPFAVFLPDDIIWSEKPTIGSMIDLYNQYQSIVLAIKQVPDEMVPNLGIVAGNQIADQVYQVTKMVEKPKLADAPSNLAIIGRYVLPPEIFDVLDRTKPGAIGEIQLTDAMATLMSSTGKAYGYKFHGAHFDTGVPLGMLKASVYAAMKREDLAPQLKEWLKKYQ